MTKLIKYFFQSIFVYFFLILGKVIGLKLSRFFFSNLFKFLSKYIRPKAIVEKNLEIYSKNISKQEKEKIAESMWSNYGMTFVEYIFLKNFRKSNSHIKIIGENKLEKVVNGKPVLFISGHFANFELMSMEITKRKIPLATIYRPLNNFFINPLMEYLRKKYICKNQIKKGVSGVREAIDYIKKKNSVALMIDQRVSEGEKINLFGKLALTTTLPAQLSKKYNLSIIPVFIKRTEENNFVIEFQNEVNPSDYKDKLALSQKLNSILEKMISKNPGQWIWTHDRWK